MTHDATHNESRFLHSFQSYAHRLLHAEVASGIVLVICTVSALLWANFAPHTYEHFWHTEIGVSIGDWHLAKGLQHWINDGLMALFFFVVGLEVKREVLVGELSSPRESMLPIAGAIGGMIAPALIYAALNLHYPDTVRGWGVPMATDIAFCLGILTLLGKRVPVAIKIFLAALAVADDLGAILVIAIFYSGGHIVWLNLEVGFAFLIALMVCNIIGVRNVLVYALIGIGGVWIFVLQSGVHATIAGILAAMTIPARPRVHRSSFIEEAGRLLREFNDVRKDEESILRDHEAQHRLEELQDHLHHADTPLSRLERRLHPWVSYLVLPLFALANAGVVLSGDLGATLAGPVSLGIIAGLFIGKPLGVFGASWLVVRVGISRKPANIPWLAFFAAACLAGIGFTMSLFIGGLAFGPGEYLEASKLAILVGSGLSAVVGSSLLWYALRPRQT